MKAIKHMRIVILVYAFTFLAVLFSSSLMHRMKKIQW